MNIRSLIFFTLFMTSLWANPSSKDRQSLQGQEQEKTPENIQEKARERTRAQAFDRMIAESTSIRPTSNAEKDWSIDQYDPNLRNRKRIDFDMLTLDGRKIRGEFHRSFSPNAKDIVLLIPDFNDNIYENLDFAKKQLLEHFHVAILFGRSGHISFQTDSGTLERAFAFSYDTIEFLAALTASKQYMGVGEANILAIVGNFHSNLFLVNPPVGIAKAVILSPDLIFYGRNLSKLQPINIPLLIVSTQGKASSLQSIAQSQKAEMRISPTPAVGFEFYTKDAATLEETIRFLKEK